MDEVAIESSRGGCLAQFGRAMALQAIGRRFDPYNTHHASLHRGAVVQSV